MPDWTASSNAWPPFPQRNPPQNSIRAILMEIPSIFLIPDQTDHHQASRESHALTILILCPDSINSFHSFSTLGHSLLFCSLRICTSFALALDKSLRAGICWESLSALQSLSQQMRHKKLKHKELKELKQNQTHQWKMWISAPWPWYFSYWFVPSAFGGNLSLEEQEMLPGITNTNNVVIQHLGKFLNPTRCF